MSGTSAAQILSAERFSWEVCLESPQHSREAACICMRHVFPCERFCGHPEGNEPFLCLTVPGCEGGVPSYHRRLSEPTAALPAGCIECMCHIFAHP